MPKTTHRIARTLAAAAGLFFFAAAPALAVVIENQDSAQYSYTVIGGVSDQDGVVGARTTTNDLCDSCTVRIDGVGEFPVSGSDRIVIRNGRATILSN